MDVNKFVEEFFEHYDSPGAMIALMVQFREASPDVQAEIMQKINARENFQGRCNLVRGEGRTGPWTITGIRPR